MAEGGCSLQRICFSEKMKYEFEVEEQSRLVFPAWKAVSFHSAAFPDQCIGSSPGQRRYFRLIAIAMQKILHLMSSFHQIQAGMFLFSISLLS